MLKAVYLVRHGETAWTVSGQHTGLTDLPLIPRGEQDAHRLRERLKGITFNHVFTSPLQRASRTCTLAGFGPVATVDDELVEWNYGAYEGKTTAEIHSQQPGWDLFQDGCPGGESVAAIANRADRVIGRLRSMDGCVLLFSSGHFLRVLASRWLGLNIETGRYLSLDPAALSIVGYEHEQDSPVIRLWNDYGRAAD
jgi:probable phosphoglycerate mutase